MKQNVAVLTTARSEYYQMRTLLRSLQCSEHLSLQLFVSGSHLSNHYGKSERDIIVDGFPIHERLPILVEDDSGVGTALTAGLCVQAIGGALQRNQTDLLLLAGDRYETLAAAVAATCANVPVGHIHGGERTDGALDEVCRHALTKLSVLHFVSTEVYRTRVIQMGESPERVFTVGAPLLDEVVAMDLLTEAQITESLDFPLRHPVALVAYHPATREKTDSGKVMRYLLEAVAMYCESIIITAPNHDPGREIIWTVMTEFSNACGKAKIFNNLGSQKFLSLMAYADLMIGNSSSGIHEAASFCLPVVNVGSRQAGRLRPLNVLDCEPETESIRQTVARALSPEFREKLRDLKNPFGDGHAGERIVAHLKQFVPFNETLCQKPFCDSPNVQNALDVWTQQHG